MFFVIISFFTLACIFYISQLLTNTSKVNPQFLKAVCYSSIGDFRMFHKNFYTCFAWTIFAVPTEGKGRFFYLLYLSRRNMRTPLIKKWKPFFCYTNGLCFDWKMRDKSFVNKFCELLCRKKEKKNSNFFFEPFGVLHNICFKSTFVQALEQKYHSNTL